MKENLLLLENLRICVYIDEIDDIVNEYNDTYHRINKMNLVMLSRVHFFDFGVETNVRI